MKVFCSLTLLFFTSLTYGQSINLESSTISFEVSNFKFKTVEGSLSSMQGEASYSSEKVEKSSFNIKIPVKTINTGIAKRDEHLLGEDYFDAANHPSILFTSVRVVGNGSEFKVVGQLTIKGISKEVELPFTKISEGGKTYLTTSFSIDRTDYKVGGNGGFSIGKEVKITVKCLIQ